jgi:hypothetical protein
MVCTGLSFISDTILALSRSHHGTGGCKVSHMHSKRFSLRHLRRPAQPRSLYSTPFCIRLPFKKLMATADSIAGLVLGIPGLIDVCVRLGAVIMPLYEDYRNADIVARDLVLKLTIQWKNMQDILENLGRIQARLGLQLESEIYQMLTTLRDHLMNALEKASKMNLFTPPGETIKVKPHATRVSWSKNDMQNILNQCREWEELISKRIIIIGISHILTDAPESQTWKGPVKRLTNTTLTTPDSFYGTRPSILTFQPNVTQFEGELVEFSSIRYVRSTIGGSERYLTELFILESPYQVQRNSRDFLEFQTSVNNTAKMLQSADAQFMSILPCPGIRELDSSLGFELYYSIPSNLVEPRSLRDLLSTPSARDKSGVLHPLDHRMRLANNLATAVLYVHSEGQFVHKHIKPENIIVFSCDGDQKFPYELGYPFLVGFDRSRSDAGRTSGRGESIPEDCIYQHPDRWGVITEHRFSMMHDVYSLGVVLLEIGLWKPFVRWGSSGRQIALKELIDLFGSKDGRPGDVRDRFIEMAQKFLPSKMGRKYTNVVVSCLSGNLEEGIDIRDQDLAARTGIGYMKNVVSRLEDLKIWI